MPRRGGTPLRAIMLGAAALTLVVGYLRAQPAAPPATTIPPAPDVRPAPTDGTAPLPIYTRQNEFAIPFKLDKVERPEQRPTAVQLHVSEDGGATWRLYEQAEPGAGRFKFRAGHDGDFLFYVRTIDSTGRQPAATAPKPELRVIVDTLAPRIELTAEQSSSGEVVARWRLLDRHLKAETLKLEFQSKTGGAAWQTVTVPVARGDQKIEQGEVTFWPGASVGDIVVRARVSDQAGNPAVTQSEIGPGVASSGGFQTASNHRSNQDSIAPPNTDWQASENNTSPGAVRWNPDQASSEPLRGRRPVEEIAPPSAIEDVPNAVVGVEAVPPPAVPFGGQSATRPASQSGGPYGMPEPESVESAPTWQGSSHPTAESLDLPDPAANAAWPAANDNQYVPAANESIASEDSLTSGANATSSRLPSGVEATFVNTRTFEIDYEVESVGAAGVGKVELWGTRDGGQSWTSFGFDNDNRSPFEAVVDHEGVYGFRIIVEAANGLGGLPPRGGDPADLWIALDLTRPTVRIQGIDEQNADGGGELKIRWEATDQQLSAKPIAISFSDRPTGPWTMLGEGLENTGEYTWRIDRRLPDRIYLQVTARDEAGNLGAAESKDPISLERLRPQGKIRGVRPAREKRQ